MAHADPTFRTYNNAQAQQYKAARGAYSPEVYDLILEFHEKGHGGKGLLVDVGCGPGTAITPLAAYFDRAVGVDPSPEMIKVAETVGGVTKSGKPIEYALSHAEDLDKVEAIQHESVDLLTAATCAHWFDTERFWPVADRILKPGGTVVLWTRASLYCHPDTPSADKVQALLKEFETETLAKYELLPNKLVRELYDELKLPWDIDPPVKAFHKEDLERVVKDRDGVPSDGKDFFGGSVEMTLAQIYAAISTASPVTRWREAHPDLAKTDKDIVNELIDGIADLVAPGTSRSRETKIRGGISSVYLLLRKAKTAPEDRS